MVKLAIGGYRSVDIFGIVSLSSSVNMLSNSFLSICALPSPCVISSPVVSSLSEEITDLLSFHGFYVFPKLSSDSSFATISLACRPLGV